MPEITVVITTYQLEAYIATCFEDLLAQTFQDFNILVVDDCSSDRTRDIVRDYATRFPARLVPLFLEKHLGSPAGARNTALDSGRIDGAYTIFLDGDDRLEATFLECLHTACIQNDADVAVCAYDRVEKGSRHVLCHELQWISGVLELPSSGGELAFLNGSLWNKLFRTSRISALRIPNFKVGEDISFGLEVFEHCNRIAFIPKELIHYQVRSNSVISNTPEEAMHAFAAELARQYTSTHGMQREAVALASFLHIGLSMALRAADNPQIDVHRYIRWARAYMKDTYALYRYNDSLCLRMLRRWGVKGYVVWASLWMYRCHCFGIALGINRIITRLCHVDIKF